MLCSSTIAAINLNVIIVRSGFDPTKDVLKHILHCELPDLRVGGQSTRMCILATSENRSIWM